VAALRVAPVGLLALIPIALALAACSSPAPVDYSSSYQSAGETVVRMGDLTPTTTVDAQVVSSPKLVVQSSTKGVVGRITRGGAAVVRGDVLATVGELSIRAPVEGIATQAYVKPGQTVPAGLPLLELEYSGFALVGSAPAAFPWPDDLDDTEARGQLEETTGPFDCTSVAAVSSRSEPDPPQPGSRRACLIPKSVPVQLGSNGVYVVTTSTLKGVLLVPVSAVAGRQGAGVVTVVEGDRREAVTVKLGPSDGTDIQIVSGLVAGQRISVIAPNLDTPHT